MGLHLLTSDTFLWVSGLSFHWNFDNDCNESVGCWVLYHSHNVNPLQEHGKCFHYLAPFKQTFPECFKNFHFKELSHLWLFIYRWVLVCVYVCVCCVLFLNYYKWSFPPISFSENVLLAFASLELIICECAYQVYGYSDGVFRVFVVFSVEGHVCKM